MTKLLLAICFSFPLFASSTEGNDIEVFQMVNGQVVIFGDDNISELITVEPGGAGSPSGTINVHVLSQQLNQFGFPNGFVHHHVFQQFQNVTGLFVDFGGGRLNRLQHLWIGQQTAVLEPLLIEGSVEVRCSDSWANYFVTLVRSEIQGDVVLDSSAYQEQLRISRSIILGNVDVNTGPVRDTVTMTDSTVVGDLSVHTGIGNDAVVLDDCVFGGRIDVRNGNGADTIDIRDSSFHSMSISMGNGNDNFILLDSHIQTSSVIRGGGHIDEGIQADNSFGRSPLFSSFELGNMSD